MTWGSNIIGDDYDAYTDELDADRAWVIKQLQQHPLFKAGEIAAPAFGTPTGGAEGAVAPGQSAAVTETPQEKERKKREKERTEQQTLLDQQVLAGSAVPGWFQDTFGKSAVDIVKDLRMKRRIHKDYRQDIDDAISIVRLVKAQEIDNVLSSMEWLDGHLYTVKSLNLKDKDLKALARYGDIRKVSLLQACTQWETANETITKLSQITGDFDEEQMRLWSDAQQLKKDARQMWRHTLHQSEKLTKLELLCMEKACNLLDYHGPMDSRAILNHISEKDGRNKGMPSVQKLGALLKTYGPEYDIYKHYNRWERQTLDYPSLLKDPWAYAAGFLDADGYVTISKNGEPRAGMVATGARGRIHCENLHEMLGCGILALDLKVHKNSKRSQHRLQFYSKSDITKLLEGTMPHLRLKKSQAGYVLEHLNLRGKDGDIITKRRDELYRLVKWENWKDVQAEELLNEWNVDEQEVLSWAERDPDMILTEVV